MNFNVNKEIRKENPTDRKMALTFNLKSFINIDKLLKSKSAKHRQ